VVPYGQRETAPQAAQRALSFGLVDKDKMGMTKELRATGDAQSKSPGNKLKAGSKRGSFGVWGARTKEALHPSELALSVAILLLTVAMGLIFASANEWSTAVVPGMATACQSERAICRNGGQCILVDDWSSIIGAEGSGGRVPQSSQPWAVPGHPYYAGPLGYASPETSFRREGVPFCVCAAGYAGRTCELTTEQAMRQLVGGANYGAGGCTLAVSPAAGGGGMAVCSNGSVTRQLTHVWYAGALYAHVGNASETLRVTSEFGV
jgi:hypothetical protein